MIKDFILSVPLIVSTLSAANAQIQVIDVAAAKKEGKVIVYGSVVPQALAIILCPSPDTAYSM
jgi:hypothetical protein